MITSEVLNVEEKDGAQGKDFTRLLRNAWVIRSGAGLALVATLTGLAGCSNDGSKKVGATPSSSPNPAPITTEQVTAGPGPAVLLPGSNHREVEQFGANSFADYITVSGMGPRLPLGGVVAVDCLATGPVEAAPTAKGKWYHLRGPAQYAGYYVAANTFENGDTTGPLDSQPAVDPAVPDCPAGHASNTNSNGPNVTVNN